MGNAIGVRSDGSTGTSPNGFTRARRYRSAVGQAPGATDFSIVVAFRNRGPASASQPFFGNSSVLATDGWWIGQVADTAGPPVLRNYTFSVIDSAAAAQTASVQTPARSPVDEKLIVLIGTFEGGTGINIYANGLLQAQDLTVGAGVTAGLGSLELGYLAAASGDTDMNNDIVLAGYIPNQVWAADNVERITARILETGAYGDLGDLGANLALTHCYQAYSLTQGYFAGTAGQLPTTWTNLGSAGTAGDLTLQNTPVAGTLETRPIYPY